MSSVRKTQKSSKPGQDTQTGPKTTRGRSEAVLRSTQDNTRARLRSSKVNGAVPGPVESSIHANVEQGEQSPPLEPLETSSTIVSLTPPPSTSAKRKRGRPAKVKIEASTAEEPLSPVITPITLTAIQDNEDVPHSEGGLDVLVSISI
jgi:hypothetical protein